MKIIQCVQGSDEWHEWRKGRVCSSQMSRIITPARGELSKQIEPYIAELCSERMRLGPPVNGEAYASHPMVRGTNVEDDARATYEFDSGLEVQPIGGILSDCGRFWSSTDGLVLVNGEAIGLLELKCPMGKQHAAYALNPQSLVAEYKVQIHGELLVSGLKFVDAYSYGVGAKGVLRRVYPDEYTEKLRVALEFFWPLYESAVARMRAEGYELDDLYYGEQDAIV